MKTTFAISRMQSVLLLGLMFCANGMRAQTTANGQVVAPGARNGGSSTPGCTGQEGSAATAANTNDPNCTPTSPGFAAPLLDTPPADAAHAVTALVRVDSVMQRPPVTLPSGNSFTVVGGATLIKVRRADQAACVATGKRISARVGAGTSTTCLDHKGELLAVEECKPGAPDCTVLTAQDIEGQQTKAPRP